MNSPIFEIIKEKEGKNYCQFAITPLEQGYGHTLGNALRRVFLKSLAGAAITSVKISGIKHQFSTLKGMKEDMVEFLLNLKKVRFIYGVANPKQQKAKISVKGPGEVKAKDIQISLPLKVANPELVLATLDKNAKIDAEMTVDFGSGYMSLEENVNRKIGVIPLDAIFSPILRVNYKIEETRVGRLTNYDKLIMEVFTDGTIDPSIALIDAAKVLVSYFNQIISPKKAKKEEVAKEDILGPVGKLSVEEIGLPTRVANALVKAGYDTVEDLVNADRESLVKVRNLGEKSIKIIAVALAEKGVSFTKEEAK